MKQMRCRTSCRGRTRCFYHCQQLCRQITPAQMLQHFALDPRSYFSQPGNQRKFIPSDLKCSSRSCVYVSNVDDQMFTKPFGGCLPLYCLLMKVSWYHDIIRICYRNHNQCSHLLICVQVSDLFIIMDKSLIQTTKLITGYVNIKNFSRSWFVIHFL